MAQHDYVVDNGAGAAFRGDINDALAAIKSSNSGASAPANPVEGMLWEDTSIKATKRYNGTSWDIMPTYDDALILAIIF